MKLLALRYKTLDLGALDALPIGIVVWVIGIALGGTTGYAINPARDFGPRLMYQMLPRKNKNANWSYSWIPIVGPLVGGSIAGLIFTLLCPLNILTWLRLLL